MTIYLNWTFPLRRWLSYGWKKWFSHYFISHSIVVVISCTFAYLNIHNKTAFGYFFLNSFDMLYQVDHAWVEGFLNSHWVPRIDLYTHVTKINAPKDFQWNTNGWIWLHGQVSYISTLWQFSLRNLSNWPKLALLLTLNSTLSQHHTERFP